MLCSLDQEFVKSLPAYGSVNVITQQLLRCGTSVGANYRAACRAKSRADFISKLKIVEEECDESIYWMELLVPAGIGNLAQVTALVTEAQQLLSIIVASIRTARAGMQSSFANRRSSIQKEGPKET
jgi:four helix bundle protein